MIKALRLALFHRLSTTILGFQSNVNAISIYSRSSNHLASLIPNTIQNTQGQRLTKNTATTFPNIATNLMSSLQQPEIRTVNKSQLKDIIDRVENDNDQDYVIIDVRGADEIIQTTGKVSDCVKNISIESIGMVSFFAMEICYINTVIDIFVYIYGNSYIVLNFCIFLM